MNAPKAFTILGPTAGGKTDLALDIAAKLPAEIISLDSVLAYHDMDIGIAKPSATERQAVPHHLIDIITPLETYSAAGFVAGCVRLVAGIHRRERLPLITGGTMMYFQALSGGLNNLPEADPTVRAALQAERNAHGLARLYRRLQAADPVTAARLKSNNSQRIERVLEVFELTGKPLSRHFDEQQTIPPPLDLHTIALIPENRALLHIRIAEHSGQMLRQSFLDEMAALCRKYPALTAGHISMCCVSYRQAWDYIEGGYGHETFIKKGTAVTRQLAKRQLTWLRKILLAQSLDPSTAQNYLQTAPESARRHFEIQTRNLFSDGLKGKSA